MKTILKKGHLTINFLIALLLLNFPEYAYCNKGAAMNCQDIEPFSLTIEQKFWAHWFSENDDATCPFEPFIVSYTKDGFLKIDNEIKKMGKLDIAILFVNVNIDNGIYYISYSTWNEADKFVNSLEWNGPNEKIRYKKIKRNQSGIINSLEKLTHRGLFVDFGNRMLLDGNSMYLTLWYDGQYSRFAVYNMKLNLKNKDEIHYLFIEGLIKMLKDK